MRQQAHLLIAFACIMLAQTGCFTLGRYLSERDTLSEANSPRKGNFSQPVAAQTPESAVVRPAAIRVGKEESTVEPQHEALRMPVRLATTGITLQDALQLALENNPAIKQAMAASSQANGIRKQVGLKPNPKISYFGEEMGNEGSGGLHGVFISQSFVRGNKLKWNRRVIGHDLNTINWDIETLRQRVQTDIQLAFYEALAAQRRLELAREFLTIVEKGVAVSEARVAAKVGTRADVLQSEIQLNEVELSVQHSEFELSASMNELAALAGVQNLGTAILVGDLAVPVNERDATAEFARIEATSPQLAAARARLDRARANLQRQKVQAIPNVSAQLGVGRDDASGDAFANVQLGLPIPIHNDNSGNIQAADAEVCAASQNVERVRQSIRRDLALVFREYNVAKATVQAHQDTILPKAKETLQLMQRAQEAGEFNFLRVLTARKAYFDANLRYVTALGKLAQANARIDGLLLANGLSQSVNYQGSDDLRGQALSSQ